MGTELPDVTQLLQNLNNGDTSAQDRLIPIVYGELRRLADHYMRRERPDHTLQATALVHQAFLKLTEQRKVTWQNKARFFGIAAQLMRRVLIDHARAHVRIKRGAGGQRLPLDEGLVLTEARSAELLAVNRSMDRLAKLDPAMKMRPHNWARLMKLLEAGSKLCSEQPRQKIRDELCK